MTDSPPTYHWVQCNRFRLIQYKQELTKEEKAKNSFEISTGDLGQILEKLGVKLPSASYQREGKEKNINVEEFKIQNGISQFTRLIRYLDPAILKVNGSKTREFWNQALEVNQFLQFTCTVRLSSLYLFSEYTRKLGQGSTFMPEPDLKLKSYIEHAKSIETNKSQKIIFEPDFSPDIAKYLFVSEIGKQFLDSNIELLDLDKDQFTVIGKIDKKLQPSDKEIIFDLTNSGMLETMGGKEIKEFLHQFNINLDNPLTEKLWAQTKDVHVTKPAMLFKPLAIYKV